MYSADSFAISNPCNGYHIYAVMQLRNTAISVSRLIFCQTFMIFYELVDLPFSYKVYNTPLFAHSWLKTIFHF